MPEPKHDLNRAAEAAMKHYGCDLAEALEQADQDYVGFCAACGESAEGMEPDARADPCECCGEAAVYGYAEILMAATRVRFSRKG